MYYTINKTVFLILSILATTLVFATGTDVLKYDTGDGYYFEYENYLDGVRVTKCVADGNTKVTIPKEIEGKRVLALGGDFLGDHITTLKIEAEIEEIPDYFVNFHDKLLRVILPEGIKRLGEDAFSYCPDLKYINLPESLEEIAAGCFDDCPKLKQIKIPDNVDKIG